MAESESGSGAAFALPALSFAADGWGPTGVPPQFEKVPFASFNRFDRVGRIADFGGFAKFATYRRFARGDDAGNAELGGYKYDAEEAAGFQRVEAGGKIVPSETAAAPRGYGSSRGGFGGGRGGARGGAGAGSAGGAGSKGYDDRAVRAAGRKATSGRDRDGGRGGRGGRGGYRGGGVRRGPGGVLTREPSVHIGGDWDLLETADFTSLSKLTTPAPLAGEKVKDVAWAGSLQSYDEDFDRTAAKAPRKVRPADSQVFYFETAKDDAVLARLVAERAPEEGQEKVVVAVTDAVLTQLMASTRSVYPWDIVITYLGRGMVFMDARKPFDTEALTVNENAHAPPVEDDEADPVNNRAALSQEATYLHQAFTQQVLMSNSKPSSSGPEVERGAEEPVLEEMPYEEDSDDDDEEGEKAEGAGAAAGGAGAAAKKGKKAEKKPDAHIAYRYRRFEVTKGFELLVRTTVNAVVRKRSGGSAAAKPAYVALGTLNEWDHKAAGYPMEWRKSADTQRGNLMALEMKNNSHKLARFTLSALLAGADSLRLGLVSRANRLEAAEHELLGVHTVQPATFASQLALNPANAFGVLRWVVESVRKHAENLREEEDDPDTYIAKFVLLRDPNKPALHLYAVAPDAFDHEDMEGADAMLGGGEDIWGGDGGATA